MSSFLSLRITSASLPAKPAGLFGVVKSTYDHCGYSRLTRNELEHGKTPPQTLSMDGLPDVERIFERRAEAPEHINLTYDLQHWLLRCQLETVTGEHWTRDEYFNWFNNKGAAETTLRNWLISELDSALRANRSHTNFYGMDNGCNYLTESNLDSQEPKWIKLLTGWACVKMVMEDDGITPRKRDINGGGVCYAFECINVNEDFWKFSPLIHLHLFDMPLVTARDVVTDKDGSRIVRDNRHIPYSQVDDKLVFPIMLPLDSVAWIPVDKIMFTDSYRPKVWIR